MDCALQDIHWVKSELQECQKLGGSKINIHIHVAAKKSIYTKGDFEKEIESEETNLNEEDWLIDYGKTIGDKYSKTDGR